AGSARIAIEDAIGATSQPIRPSGARFSWKRILVFLAAAMLVGAVAAWVLEPSASEDHRISRLQLNGLPAERLVWSAGSNRPSRTAIALSPDGRTVVFNGVRGTAAQLFKRNLDEEQATPMAGTEGARGPFFSADGQWIGFWANNKLKKVALAGGPTVEICQCQDVATRANWGSDDTIVFASGEGILRVAAGGGKPVPITRVETGKSEVAH